MRGDDGDDDDENGDGGECSFKVKLEVKSMLMVMMMMKILMVVNVHLQRNWRLSQVFASIPAFSVIAFSRRFVTCSSKLTSIQVTVGDNDENDDGGEHSFKMKVKTKSNI